MSLSIKPDARQSLDASEQPTRQHATKILEQLSPGFEVTWFRETSRLLWLAALKPSSELEAHFGLHQECFLIGNGFTRDFHQVTLNHAPPLDMRDRLDPSLRFVASDAQQAPALCAAYAQTKRIRVVLLDGRDHGGDAKESLYRKLSQSLWRHDLFAEAEPVRNPGEFFGREQIVNLVLSKALAGAPLAILGLRKIGKSSLLGRVEDLLRDDQQSITVTASIFGNSARIKGGRWHDAAHDLIKGWQTSLTRRSRMMSSKIEAKAGKLSQLLTTSSFDMRQVATAISKDISSLLKTASALAHEHDISSVRLIAFVDECDHMYPHVTDAGHWRDDFFTFWDTLQATKRSLESPEQLVYVLSGVNPSGVEQGRLAGRPNPLYDMQRLYLAPMDQADAEAMLRNIGSRMGLNFSDESLATIYELVGGHPLLLRRFGTAIHEMAIGRGAKRDIKSADITKTWARRKRDFYNQVSWILEHLRSVAPDEERLLRDIATKGIMAYASDWSDNDFRETFADHLEKYGLIRFENDVPTIGLDAIRFALQKPAASNFPEQKQQLKELVDAIESAMRARVSADLQAERNESEAIQDAVHAVPNEAKSRGLDRAGLMDLGSSAGLEAVLQAMAWGDYLLIIEKFYDRIRWVGANKPRDERISIIRDRVKQAHVIRHNNDHQLRQMIMGTGFDKLFASLSELRDMLA
jgi:hypothetical protein